MQLTFFILRILDWRHFFSLNGTAVNQQSQQQQSLQQHPQRIVELLNNQVKQLQHQKSSMELSMMDLKNELTEER